jgi:glycosyltransferase involved in cell wall biosynthesis
MTKIKVLHIIPALSGGGAERQLSYLSVELCRIGHEVHILYSKDGPSKPEMPGVILHQLVSRSNYDPYLIWQLDYFIRRIEPDIIQTWIPQMDILGGLIARLHGIPFIIREPNSAMAYPSTLKNRLRAWTGSLAAGIVSNSRGGDGCWKSIVPSKNRHIVSNGLPFEDINNFQDFLPQWFEIPKEPFILYVGRLSLAVSCSKNLKDFIKALVLVKKNRDVMTVICGDGPQRSELEMMCCHLGLSSHVCFTGHLQPSSVYTLMNNASVFVSLSMYEGLPNTVMEAMACGCPLVLSDIPAHREILDESCAYFVDPSNTKKAADAILHVLSDMNGSSERTEIAKQKTLKWSIPRMARQYENIYLKTIKSK